jgi:hypothetical protein
MKQKLVALSAVLVLALSACGGGDGGGRPSQEDIAGALNDESGPFASVASAASDSMIDCMAKAIHDSDLSDESLQALVDGDEDFDGTDEDRDAAQAVASDMTACATA